MKYVLQQLLTIRIGRRDDAEKAMLRSLVAVTEAEAAVVARKKDLEDYIAWRIAEENRLYEKVMKQMIQRQKLDDLLTDVQLLRGRESEFRERILQAEKALEDAKKKLIEDTAAHQEAMRKCEKLEEHKKLWMAEMDALQEQAVEKEMEDFRVRDPDIEENDTTGDELDAYSSEEEEEVLT